MNILQRIIALLVACTASSLVAADTSANWKHHCAKCHGEDGRGDTKTGHKLNISDLTDATFQSKFTDREAFDSVKVGLKSAKGKVIMKAVPGLTDDEINALVGHVRSLKK